MSSLRDQRGIAGIVEILLVIVVVGVIGFTVYTVQHRQNLKGAKGTPVPSAAPVPGTASAAAAEALADVDKETTDDASFDNATGEVKAVDGAAGNLEGSFDEKSF